MFKTNYLKLNKRKGNGTSIRTLKIIPQSFRKFDQDFTSIIAQTNGVSHLLRGFFEKNSRII